MVGPVHVGQEGDASGAEDHCHYLQVNSKYCMWHIILYPDANKLLVENDPGQKVDKRRICGEEGGDHGAVQDPERCYVEVVGQH